MYLATFLLGGGGEQRKTMKMRRKTTSTANVEKMKIWLIAVYCPARIMSAIQSQSEITQDIGGSIFVGRGTLGSHSTYAPAAATTAQLWTVSPDRPSTISVAPLGAGVVIELPDVAATAVDVSNAKASGGHEIRISNTSLTQTFTVSNFTSAVITTIPPGGSVLFIAEFAAALKWIIATNTAAGQDTLQTAYNNQRVGGTAPANIVLDASVAPAGRVGIQNDAADTQLSLFRVASGAAASTYLEVGHIAAGTANDPFFAVGGGTASGANSVAIGGASATASGAIALARAGTTSGANSTLVGSAASTVTNTAAGATVLASANIGNTVAFNQANALGLVTAKTVLVGSSAGGTIVMPGAAGTSANQSTRLGLEITTTNTATPATIDTVAIPTSGSVLITTELIIVNSGVIAERGRITLTATAYNSAGTVSVLSTTSTKFRPGALIATDAAFTASGANLLVRVTGLAAGTVIWRAVSTTVEYL